MLSMKRVFILLAVVAITGMFFIACGGGGGGKRSGLGLGGFIKTVALGIDGPWSAPFTTDVSDHEQHLFFSSDINGAGSIESIAFRYQDNEPASINCPDVTIMLGQTTMSALASTYTDNVEQGRGSLTTVKSGALTAPAGSAGDYFTITLDTPFDYNGVDNLVVEFARTQACDGNIRLQATGSTYTDVGIHRWNLIDVAGDLYDNYLNAKFAFEGGDNAQHYGGSSNNSWPFSSSLPRTQNLYLASNIDGSGPITGLAFQLNQASTGGTYTYSVTMGHTTLSALGATFDSNYDTGSPVTVANAATFTIPAGIPAGEWFWVPLPDRTFIYNGVDNLIVEIEVTVGTGLTNLRITNLAAGTRAWGNAGNDVATGIDSTAYHVKLRFNGGPMEVITDGGGSYNPPIGWSSEFINQYLYDNTALGTGGRITGISLRMNDDESPGDFEDINVVLGHTSLSALGTTFSDNIQSDYTVAFSGTLSLPAALKVGDWLEIPFSTPFTYDPTKNLVIQWDGPGTSSTLNSIGHTLNSGRYPGHGNANVGDRSSATATNIYDLTFDLRLIIEK